jgi:hypothetical protein
VAVLSSPAANQPIAVVRAWASDRTLHDLPVTKSLRGALPARLGVTDDPATQGVEDGHAFLDQGPCFGQVARLSGLRLGDLVLGSSPEMAGSLPQIDVVDALLAECREPAGVGYNRRREFRNSSCEYARKRIGSHRRIEHITKHERHHAGEV